MLKKEFLQITMKKTEKSIQKWTRDLNSHSTKEDIKMTMKHIKRHALLLVIREIYIIVTMINHQCQN